MTLTFPKSLLFNNLRSCVQGHEIPSDQKRFLKIVETESRFGSLIPRASGGCESLKEPSFTMPSDIPGLQRDITSVFFTYNSLMVADEA
jgi:hypothetical protein